MRGSETQAKLLAADARERGLRARACLDPRFGWVVRVKPERRADDEEVIIRNFSELMDVLTEEAGWS